MDELDVRRYGTSSAVLLTSNFYISKTPSPTRYLHANVYQSGLTGSLSFDLYGHDLPWAYLGSISGIS